MAAARSAQGGDATGSAKTRDGNVEAMRVLRVARRSARGSRTQAINQMRSLISTAPEELRAELRDLSIYKVLTVASAYRHTGRTDVATVTKLTLRTLARRALSLEEEVKEIDRLLEVPRRRDRTRAQCSRWCGHRRGFGPPGGRRRQPRAPEERIHLRQALRGLSPRCLERQAARHRLNRSGDRQANSALWHIVFTRMVNDPEPSTTSIAG